MRRLKVSLNRHLKIRSKMISQICIWQRLLQTTSSSSKRLNALHLHSSRQAISRCSSSRCMRISALFQTCSSPSGSSPADPTIPSKSYSRSRPSPTYSTASSSPDYHPSKPARASNLASKSASKTTSLTRQKPSCATCSNRNSREANSPKLPMPHRTRVSQKSSMGS